MLGLGACMPAASAPVSSTAGASVPPSRSSTTSAMVTTTSVPTTTTVPHRLVVVGLGDSVMAGTACGCQPFIARYASALATREHGTARVENLGRAGLTVPGLMAQISATAGRRTLGAASVIVVTIGANDLTPLVGPWQDGACGDACVGDATARLSRPLAEVFRQIRSEAPHDARILVTTYWNVFEDGDVADGDFGAGFALWSDGVTGNANDQICIAARWVDATCVDLYLPFNGAGGKDPTPLLADDGDHPDAAGHALIAKTLLAATPAGSS